MLIITSFECIFNFFNSSRLVELPSYDEMEMFYTEHDFEISSGENITVVLRSKTRLTRDTLVFFI